MKSFLQRIQARHPDGKYAGDQRGGGAGEDGRGLPTGAHDAFRFASGIECSYPTIDHGRVRRDMLAECGHYERWREDFGLAKELGLKSLRYGLPLHRICEDEGRFVWDFADEVLGELKRLEIEPILDLLHFGAPSAWGDFQNPELPLLFADYCARVADRYPWIRAYTPVNEVFVTARNSARDGLWNEQLKSDSGFVTATKHLVAASILATHEIAARRPDAIFIQSESAECMHEMTPTQSAQSLLDNQLRYLSLDLLYANMPRADVLLFLLDNGMTREELEWFMRGEPPGYQVMGIDYYGRNERIRKPSGEVLQSEDVFGWGRIAQEYWRRFKKPVFLTETNTFDPVAAPAWMWKQWANVLDLRDQGVPVLGFTWYSLIDQIDWDTQLAEKNGNINQCGIYTLDRKPNNVAGDFRMLLETFGRIGIVPHAELLTVTDKPARLKVQV
ncbi:MAG: glycoside hydrolase family 1 protein [Caulobacteraceae bacterium]|nr:glycoside hydrolase family 1 protein [Caulobacter sp.]